MEKKNYHKSITTNLPPAEAFEKINHIGHWWTNSFKGSAKKLNDTFSVKMGETTVDFKIAEVVPDRKIVWLVTDCYLSWINKKDEWKNTKIVFEMTEENNQTKIEMTHVGLVEGVECYNDCVSGWDHFIGESLGKYLKTGEGLVFEENARISK